MNIELTQSIQKVIENPALRFIVFTSLSISFIYSLIYFIRVVITKRKASKQQGFLMQVIPPKYVKDENEDQRGTRFALQRFIDNLTASVKDERISFEIYADNSGIKFLVWTPTKQMQELVKLNLFSKYKERVKVKELDFDPLLTFKEYDSKINEYKTAKHEIYMLMDVKDFDAVDPVNDILGAMIGLYENEKILFQVVLKPTQLDKVAFNKAKEHFRLNKSEINWFQIFLLQMEVYFLYFIPLFPIMLIQLLAQLVKGISSQNLQTDPLKLMHDSDPRKIFVQSDDLGNFNKRIDEKYKTAFTTYIRVIATGNNRNHRLNSIEQALETLKSETQNKLVRKQTNKFNEIRSRFIYPEDKLFPFYKEMFTSQVTLSSREVSMLYHLPTEIIDNSIENFVFPDIPAKKLFRSKSSQYDLYLGDNFIRGKSVKTYLNQNDRARHITALGQTGTGKSTILTNSTLQDIVGLTKGVLRGGINIDPHEELFLKILHKLPYGSYDLNKIIPWDTRSEEYYFGFNPLYAVNMTEREISLVVDSTYKLIEKLVKRLNPEAGMGVTGKPMLMYAMETLMIFQLEWLRKNPDKIDTIKRFAPTLLDIRDLYLSDEILDTILSFIPLEKYEKLRSFWQDILPNYKESKAWPEIRLGFDNKISQVITGILFYTFAQSQSSIDFSKAIRKSKFILVNVSSKNLGEEGMSLLGSLLMSKVWFEAKKIEVESRRPFVVYADEFQNFATSDFSQALSEARKFKLELFLANQFSAQLPDDVRDAINGNVKTRIYYRVGLDDSESVSDDLQRKVLYEEVMETPEFHAFVRSGENVFTINIPKEVDDNYSSNQVETYILDAYEKYGKSKTEIDNEIINRKNWVRDGCLPL